MLITLETTRLSKKLLEGIVTEVDDADVLAKLANDEDVEIRNAVVEKSMW